MWADARATEAGSRSGGDSLPGSERTRAKDRRAGAAFTLIEILLAVALIGLLGAAMVMVGSNVTDGRPRSAHDMFWEATKMARRTALKTEREVRLSYDAKEKAFILDGAEGQRQFPVPATRDLSIDLLQAQASGGSILIGGQLVDTQTLAVAKFYPDGTCTPFRVQIRTTGPAHIESIDPWTCAPVLADPKKT